MSAVATLRAKLERDLMAIDQKIERQDQAIAAATEARSDLHISRAMLLAAMAVHQEAAE